MIRSTVPMAAASTPVRAIMPRRPCAGMMLRAAAVRPLSSSTSSSAAGRSALVSTLFYLSLPIMPCGALYYYYVQNRHAARLATLSRQYATGERPALTPETKDTFIDFTLKDRTEISPNTAVFTFKLPPDAASLGLPTASCVLASFVDGITSDGKPKVVSRPYTPLEDPAKGYTGTFELLVKKYPQGPMSSHIHSLRPGDTLSIKGPILKFPYKPNTIGHVGMVAGGTGITPMLQLIHRALSDPSDTTKLSLVFANVTENDILLKDQLDDLASKHPQRFKVFYTVDRPSSEGWKYGKGFVSEDMIKQNMPKPGEGKVFVCGPGPMVAHVAGSKAPDYSQGEVGGLLKKMGYKKDDVFKF